MFHFTRFLPQWRRLLLSLLLVLPGLALAAIDGACQPNHWPDGDTFHYKNSKGQVVKVRVAGFDAPERGQPFSKVARERLVALTEGGARCHCERKDKYGRQVCTVRTPPGENVAVIMLRERFRLLLAVGGILALAGLGLLTNVFAAGAQVSAASKKPSRTCSSGAFTFRRV